MDASKLVWLSCGVQHHPRRASLLPGLLEALSPLWVDVVADPAPLERPSAWRTYRQALETTPSWATHRLIIQDDGVPCRHFAEVILKAVQAKPANLLTLCVCGNAIRATLDIHRKAAEGDEWLLYPAGGWVPVVATVWPVGLIEPALAYVDAQQWPSRFSADDEIVGRIAQNIHLDVYATIPSLVVHDDAAESLIRPRQHLEDVGRITSCPPPDGCDLRLQTWA